VFAGKASDNRLMTEEREIKKLSGLASPTGDLKTNCEQEKGLGFMFASLPPPPPQDNV